MSVPTYPQPGQGYSPPGAHPEFAKRPASPGTGLGRLTLAFLVDLALALGTGAVVFLVLFLQSNRVSLVELAGVAVTVGLSFLNNVVLQSLTQASLGKALTGLRVVSKADGGRPGFWQLAWWWVSRVYQVVFGMAEWLSKPGNGGFPWLRKRIAVVPRSAIP